MNESKHTAGCGKMTHVAGTNGGKMPCGELLKWPDGGQARILCAVCQNAAELNVPEQFASAPSLLAENARLRDAINEIVTALNERSDKEFRDGNVEMGMICADLSEYALKHVVVHPITGLALAEGGGR